MSDMNNKESELKFTEFEKGLIVNGLLSLKHAIMRNNVPVEPINELIAKVIDSKERKEKWRDDREER